MRLRIYRKDKPNQILTVLPVENKQEADNLRRSFYVGHRCKIIDRDSENTIIEELKTDYTTINALCLEE